jgi:thiosulfate dehydrogenase [quinone] large subunit
MFPDDAAGLRKVVALLRITLGVIILVTWVENLTKGTFSGGGISGLFAYIFEENGGGSAFYRTIIRSTILQAPAAFGAFQLVAEFLLGVGLLLGLFTPLAGLGAGLFFVNLTLAFWGGQEWIWTYVLLSVASVVVALTRSGRAWGIDAWLLARRGEPSLKFLR